MNHDNVEEQIDQLVVLFKDGLQGLRLVGNSLLHYAAMLGGRAVLAAYKILAEMEAYQHLNLTGPNKMLIYEKLAEKFELSKRQVIRRINVGILYKECPRLVMVHLNTTEL